MYLLRTMITSRAVKDIRESYSQYEHIMYGNFTYQIYHAGDPYYRGMDGHFNPANFQNLDDELTSVICQVPLSQPLFIGTILLIWTLTCIHQIRQTWLSFIRLVWTPET